MKPTLATLLLALLPFAAVADDEAATDPDIAPTVEAAWIRLLPGDLPAAGYFVLKNPGDRPRELTSVTSDTWGEAMLHESLRESGMQRMKAVPAVRVPAHGQVAFKPGGYHLMLMQRHATVAVGDTVVLVLHFADGQALDVPFELRAANAED